VIGVSLAAGALAWLSLLPGSASAATQSVWAGMQGGPQHLGTAPAAAGASPPLRVAWRWPGGKPTGSLGSTSTAVVAGGLAVVLTQNDVVALDPDDGTVRWRLVRATGYLDPPAVDPTAGSSGIVVFAQGRSGTKSSLEAADLARGTVLWRFPEAGLTRRLRGAPVIAGGTVFAGAGDGHIYAVDLATGASRWSFATGGAVQTSPAVADGLVFAVAEDLATGRSTLFAVDAATGKQQWTFSPSGFSLHVTPPTVADGRVFVGFGDGLVRAFDDRSGALEWSSDVRYPFSPFNGLAFAGGALYTLDVGGGLYRFDARTGELVWDFQFLATALRSAPLVAQGYVYVGLDDGTVAAVGVRTGRQAWATQLDAGTAGIPAPAGPLVLVPYTGTGGGLVAFRHVDGPLMSIESPTTLHPVIAVANFGVAFVIVLVCIVGLFTAVRRREANATGTWVEAAGDARVADPPNGGYGVPRGRGDSP
jgi:outer membrane protein assembly factor BamB